MITEEAQVKIRATMEVGDIVSNVGTIQKTFNKLKLPEKLGENLKKNIGEFYKEYDKYQKKVTDGVKTQGDYNQIEKSLSRMRSLYGNIGKELEKTTKLSIDDIIDLGKGDFKHITDEISKAIKDINNVKIDKNALIKPFEEIKNLTKSKNVVGDKGILNNMLGNINKGDMVAAKKDYQELLAYADKVATRTDANGKLVKGTMGAEKYQQLTSALNVIGAAFDKAEAEAAPFIAKLNELQSELSETKTATSNDILGKTTDFNKEAKNVEKVTESLKRMHQEEYSFNRQAQDIDRQIQTYFGLSQMIRKVGDIARDAFNTVKELDAAMVETAVVTNFDVGDMWDMLPTYTENANQLGSTIKDVYEAATLYYQQGLNTSQSMGLANETLKMARIGGLQAAEATNMMTAALRGFNMEINQTSATRVNDVYSELAAITAADTKEIGSAMERTASIANSANMEFETTSAFLAQMIETTREAPENLGTAMKTIIARFQEMKQDPTKLVDSEGVALDANKIDTALKTIGVNLTNTKGEFRDLDDVFLDISAKWDSLTQGQQRYIATIAAGSRQQSRFIAMMQNYERVKELVDAANNSAGAGQKQFEKTLDSMSAKLNRLKNAWDQFTMGLMNNQILKGGVDALTGFFTVVNKIFDILAKPFPDPFGGLIKSALTLTSTLAMLNLGKKGARGAVMAGVGWWKNEGKVTENFKAGWGVSSKEKKPEKNIDTIYQQQLQKRLTSTAKAQMPIGVSVKATLEKIDTATLGPKVKEALRSRLKELEAEVNQGKITEVDAKIKFKEEVVKQGLHENTAESLASGFKEGTNNLGQFESKIGGLTSKIASAGAAMQQFGTTLGGPVGAALSTAGTLLMTLGSALDAVAVSFTKNLVAEVADATGKTADMVATEGLSKAQIKAAITSNALGKALWASLGPLVIIVAAIGAAVAAYKLLDKAIVTDKEKLESTSDAAAAASEAFDSAKQETSELQDSLARIRETENSFDSLVAGTAEFNEQLVTANEQITDLINKYPMLLEEGKNYVTTDQNGLMHVTEAGLKAVEEYQKQVQARASAVSIIQAADLASLENEQKAQRLYRDWSGGEEEHKKNIEKADILKEQAKTGKELARQNAIRTTLSDKEVRNVEALSSIYADLYEQKRKAAETDVEQMDKHDIRQKYADYHGYTYTKANKKITDTEGNEVEYDDAVLKDEVIEQTVLLDFEENAGSLDQTLNNLDSKFSDILEKSFDNSSHFISDLLSSNIETNTDIIEEVLKQPNQLQKIVDTMSNKEVEAVLGLTAGTVTDANFDTYSDQVVNKLTEKASNIVQAQYESYSQLAGMMAQSAFGTIEKANTKQNQEAIRKQIQELSIQEADILSSIGQQLQENVGTDVMATFIEQASDIYLQKNQELTDEFNSILNEINFESPTSRLEGYNKMIDSSNKKISDLGKSMQSSASEANLLGSSFEEFLSKDWEGNLSESADDFKNSLGEIDTAGIIKASEESKTLKSLLDSGKVSASAVAAALQGIEEGKYSISAVDTTVLQLLSSLNRLVEVAAEAHKIIENFDPGIDTGEGEDFVIENAEKTKEYMDNNEWGNEQLQNYIKLAAGEERWNEALRKNHGDLKKTTKALSKYVTKFSDGFQPAWDDMIAGKGINGKSLTENIDKAVENGNIEKGLGEQFKKVKTYWDDNGFMQWDFGDLTTDQLETYFKEAYGLSDEYSKLLMQDMQNYNETEGAKLAANDLNALIKSEDFQKNRGVDASGKPILTDAELDVIKEAPGGAQALEQLAQELGYVAKDGKTAAEVMENSAFKVNNEKTGEARDDYKTLTRDYAKTFKTGEHSIKSLLNEKTLQDKNNRLDINTLMTDLKSKSFNQEQAQQSAWLAYQSAQKEGKETSFDGVALKNGIKSYEEFIAEIEKGPERVQWHDIGQSIAEGIIDYINGNREENKENKGESKNKGEGKNKGENTDKPRNKDDSKPKTTTTTTGENKSSKESTTGRWRKEHEGYDTGGSTAKKAEGLFDVMPKVFSGIKDFFGGYKEKVNEGKETQKNNLGLNGETKSTTDTNLETAQNRLTKMIESGYAQAVNNINPDALNTAEAQEAMGRVYALSMSPKTDTLTQGILNDFATLGIDVQNAIDSGLVIDTNGILSTAQQKGTEAGNAASEGAESGMESTDTSGAKSKGETTGKKIAKDAEEGTEKGLSTPPSIKSRSKGSSKTEQPKQETPQTTETPKEATYTAEANYEQVEQAIEKVKELNIAVSAGGTYKLNVPGAGKIQKAAAAAKELSGSKTEKTVSIKTGKADTSSLDKLKSSISKTKGTVKVKADTSQAATKVSTLVSNINSKSAKVKVTAYYSGGTINIPTKADPIKPHTGGLAVPGGPIYRAKGGSVFKRKGTDTIPAMLTPGEYVQKRDAVQYFGVDFMQKLNHKDLIGALKTLGSAANGRYGRLGPNGKGGLTLTGEEGFEIAWLPSESRSMILGANGPQMVDLPGDAVVYTHKQSRKIMSNGTISAGSHSGRTNNKSSSSGNGGNGGNGGSNKTDKQNSDNAKKTAENNKTITEIVMKAGKVSVWWENITRRIDGTQKLADRALKTFERQLKLGGTTLNSIKKYVNDYRKQLDNSIKLNEAAEKKATGELKAIDNKKSNRTVEWEATKKTKKRVKTKKGKKKWKTTTKTIKKKSKVDISKYIDYDAASDTYTINQAAIDGDAGKSKKKAEAIKAKVEEEINDRITKRDSAKDKLESAREALRKLNDDVYETFSRWEKSINNVYLLSQRLEELTKRISIAGTRAELQFTKLEAGYGTALTAVKKGSSVTKALNAERDSLFQQAKAKEVAMESAQSAFLQATDYDTYINKYLGNSGSDVAGQDFDAAKKAFAILNKAKKADGTYDYTTATNYINDLGLTGDEYNKVKEILDNIFEAQNSYLDSIDDAYQAQAEIYQKIEEMQSFIAEFEEGLLKGIEEQAEDQIKHLDKLNSALTKAFKDLIDEVKRKLDERRKNEDNTKTESDISKKQQRLAMLRADTSGGHAVEIAQLEKEISEAQQSYQRTLEDQLLDKLQQQGDEAEKQRQRQIDLLEAQKELAKQTGTNLAQIKVWLQDPEAYQEDIKKAWLENNNYDELPPASQQQLLEKFEAEFGKYLSYAGTKTIEGQIDQYKKQITEKSLPNIEKKIDSVADAIEKINPDTSAGSNYIGSKGKPRSTAEMRTAGYTAKDLTGVKKNGKRVYSDLQIARGGYKKDDLKAAGISLKNLREKGFKASEAKAANYTAKDLQQAGYKDIDIAKAGYKAEQLKKLGIDLKKLHKQGYTAKEARAAGYTVKELRAAGYSDEEIKGGGYTVTEFHKGGGTVNEAKAAGYKGKEIAGEYGAAEAMGANISGSDVQAGTGKTAKQLQGTVNKKKGDGATQSDMRGVSTTIDINGKKKGGKVKAHIGGTGKKAGREIAARKGSTLYVYKWNTKKGKRGKKKGTYKIEKLTPKLIKSFPIEGKGAVEYAIRHTKPGKQINKNWKNLVKTAKLLDTKHTYTLNNKKAAVLGGKTGHLFYKKDKNNVYEWNPAKKQKKVPTKKIKYETINDKKNFKKYKTGGLATQTGLAWLDGTPSKPEIVLNAQDTKNFLALKDILNHAMSSAKNVSNTYGGDSTYNININVDHINNDYDVDKIADRVKKNIVKDANYRNVTQVRNLR